MRVARRLWACSVGAWVILAASGTVGAQDAVRARDEAIRLYNAGRDREALAAFDAAIRLDPEAAPTRRYRGALLSRLGQHEQALLDLGKAIELDPKDAGAYKDRGGVYNRLGAYAQALRDLDESLRLD